MVNKNVSSEVLLIQKFQQDNIVELVIDEVVLEGLLKKDGSAFILEINTGSFSNFESEIPFRFSLFDENYLVNNYYVSSRGFSTAIGPNIEIVIHGFEIKRTNTQDLFCRCILPLAKGINLNTTLFEDLEVYGCEGVERKGLLRVKAEQFPELELFFESNKYLIVDSAQKVGSEEFSEACWSLFIGVGYATGILPQNEEYIFYTEHKDRKFLAGSSYSTLRKSIHSLYKPIDTNPKGWGLPEDVAGPYFGKIEKFGSHRFSKLCELVHNNHHIKAMLLLFIEAISGTLMIMPAGLSVVLEGISDHFYAKEGSRIKPITDKKFGDIIIFDLMKTLEKYNQDPRISQLAVLESKIRELNAPTNRQRLKFPFVCLEIPLTPVDELALEFRNQFLHGNINLNPKNGKPFSMDSFEIALRLLTLVNAVFMKMIGYHSYIINHVKMQERGLGKKIEEEPFRLISK